MFALKTQEQCEYGHSTYFSNYKNQEIRIKYYFLIYVLKELSSE